MSVVVVTGANGLVGAAVCRALLERDVTVRGVVRRPGTAPAGVEEHVGEFFDPDCAATACEGADAVVTTVHPMGSDRDTQERIGVEGTTIFARAARDAGVALLVHISTAAVYDRSPTAGDVDESSALVGDDDNDYAVTKRDTDHALAGVDGLTRVVLRPPQIFGVGETSVWNTLRPRAFRDHEEARHAVPGQTLAWVHVDDLAALTADVASGRTPTADGPDDGPLAGELTAVNVCAGNATQQDYYQTLARVVGADAVWEDRPAWTARLLATRAAGWGWRPAVDLAAALAEIERP